MSDDMRIDPERIYSISIAAHLLSVSASTLRDFGRRGKLECTKTPGGQRRFAGAELLRFRQEATSVAPKKPGAASASGMINAADSKARQAWLGPLVARAQRELSVETPGEIRVRLGADLEHTLRDFGPASPISDVDPFVNRLIDGARRQTREAQEDTQHRETKGQLLEYAQAHLRRSIDGLPRRVVGTTSSLKRLHVRATLRDQLHDRLQKRLKGDEAWHQVRDRVDEFVAAWYVGQTPGLRVPDTVKILAAGVTGVVGGATAAAALDPRVRAAAANFKEPLLLLALNFLKRFNTPPPSAPPNPSNQTTTQPPSGPSTGIVGVSLPAYGRAPTARRGYNGPLRMMPPAYRGAARTPQRGEP